MCNRRRLALAAVVAAFGLAIGAPAEAHGFMRRFDLPVPLWLYLSAAGATVAVSFAMAALFMRSAPAHGDYPRHDLRRWRLGRLVTHRSIALAIRLLGVALFLLVIVAGLFGTQNTFKNIVPILVWVIWWVGLAYVSALIGNVWALLNPWRSIFAAGEALARRLMGEDRPWPRLAYPERLGAWPAAIVFLAFVWVELAWRGGETPANIAAMALGYSLLTWAGMAAFGREQWLRGGEAFSAFFTVLARFSPTELRVVNRDICAICSSPICGRGSGDCIDCHECFARADQKDREINLRPHGVGLLTAEPVAPSMVIFVMLMLATVTFDGFLETPAWSGLQDWLLATSFAEATRTMGASASSMARSAALVVFALLFLLVYRGFCALMAKAAGRSAPSAGTLAGLFILSLVPISIAYHLAHYLSFLLIAGQFVIPLSSDPMGIGWDLFNTKTYLVDIGIVGARFVWYLSVAAIVVGHIVAVWLAHATALRTIPDARAALRSQYPMLALMVGYTMISLWILSQPVVAAGSG